jgi:hypothetical protein
MENVMDHDQFEILIAAVLTAGAMNASGCNDASRVVHQLASMHAALLESGIIVKKNVAFVPKAGR